MSPRPSGPIATELDRSGYQTVLVGKYLNGLRDELKPRQLKRHARGWDEFDIIYENARPDAIAMHLNLAAFVGRGTVDPIDNLLKVVEKVQTNWPGQAHFALALRSDGSPELDESKRQYRERARQVNVPVYDEIPELATALAAISRLEHKLA